MCIGYLEKLESWYPGSWQHNCSYALWHERRGFAEREEMYIGRLLVNICGQQRAPWKTVSGTMHRIWHSALKSENAHGVVSRRTEDVTCADEAHPRKHDSYTYELAVVLQNVLR